MMPPPFLLKNWPEWGSISARQPTALWCVWSSGLVTHGQFNAAGRLTKTQTQVLSHPEQFWQSLHQFCQKQPKTVLALGYEAQRWCDGFSSTALVSTTTWPVAVAMQYQHWYVGADETDIASSLSPVATPFWQPSFSEAAFVQAVMQTQQAITQGEFYQANLSMRFDALSNKTQQAEKPEILWELFQHLCQLNPSPYSAWWQTPFGTVVCNSPEQLLAVNGAQVMSRPIAGTRKRSPHDAKDQALAVQLQKTPKEQAEHRMLVDLVRNDLGRVCQLNSVTVSAQEQVERYSSVQHLVSQIEGELKPEKDWLSSSLKALRAVFPGGTITGCPKQRSTQWINTLEPVSRNWYTGSMGLIDTHTRTMSMNILIRSLFAQKYSGQEHWHLHAGAGIVADSNPQAEYQECLQKLGAFSSYFPSLMNPKSCSHTP